MHVVLKLSAYGLRVSKAASVLKLSRSDLMPGREISGHPLHTALSSSEI